MTLLLLEKFPTIEELLHNAEVKMPQQFGTFKQAQRVQLETILELMIPIGMALTE